MASQIVVPDTINYNTAISACAKGGQWMEALGLLREAKTNTSNETERKVTHILSTLY